MIDIKKLEKNEDFLDTGMGYAEAFKVNLKNRGDNPELVDQALDLNKKRKTLTADSESAKAEQNKTGKEIALLKKEGKDASSVLEAMQKLAAKQKDLNAQADTVSAELTALLSTLPNMAHPSTPVGASEDDNREEKSVGTPKKLSFEAKDHVDLGEALDILDAERAAKVTGARFTFLKGAGASLERALSQFMIDLHTKEHGYTEISPPLMLNADSMYGTSQFPKFKEEQFEVKGMDYYLCPTAEVPVTNLYRNEILSEDQLPTYFSAFTPCFRAEAGSYGKDTRGLFRQHQFYKVELVKFTRPEDSYEEHEKLTQNAERVLELLELPYKRMALCSGDIGFGASKCYDLEVYLPGQGKYREISSCSNFEDFQARRANIRFRPQGGKPEFVHTINGSGLALGRCWIAVLENYQQEDGSIKVPEVLQPYMNNLKEIRK